MMRERFHTVATAVLTVVAATLLYAVGYTMRLIIDNYGLGTGAVVGLSIFIGCLCIAGWLDIRHPRQPRR